MRVNSIVMSILYKLLPVIIGLYGLLLAIGIFDGRFDLSPFRFFTVLSNFLSVLYFATDIVYILKTKKPVWFPALKGTVTMAVTVTLLVAHFVLGIGFTMDGTIRTILFIMHYAVPILTILDWLLFDPKGLMTFRSPLLWAAGPLLYFVYAMIAARIGDGIGYGGSRYPYPFLDVDLFGWGRVLLTVLIMTAFFIALGDIFVLIDKGLKRISLRKKEEEKA